MDWDFQRRGPFYDNRLASRAGSFEDMPTGENFAEKGLHSVTLSAHTGRACPCCGMSVRKAIGRHALSRPIHQ